MGGCHRSQALSSRRALAGKSEGSEGDDAPQVAGQFSRDAMTELRKQIDYPLIGRDHRTVQVRPAANRRRGPADGAAAPAVAMMDHLQRLVAGVLHPVWNGSSTFMRSWM